MDFQRLINLSLKEKWFYCKTLQVYFKVINFPDIIIYIDNLNGKLDLSTITDISFIEDDYLEADEIIVPKRIMELNMVSAKSLLTRNII